MRESLFNTNALARLDNLRGKSLTKPTAYIEDDTDVISEK